MTNRLVFLATAYCVALATGAEDPNPRPLSVRVENGVIRFDSATNFSAISVHGRGSGLRAAVQARRTSEALLLEDIQASLPVKALGTGMGLRDEHMRKYIFSTSSGALPDLAFTASNLKCVVQPASEKPCQITGELAIRGVSKPFAMTLKLRQEGGSPAVFKASGEAVVKLSDYGIERPSQLGVQTQDEVKLNIEFTGRETIRSARSSGGLP